MTQLVYEQGQPGYSAFTLENKKWIISELSLLTLQFF